MPSFKALPHATKFRLTLFAGVVGVFVVVISARLLLVTGIPRTATADPKAQAAPAAKAPAPPTGASGATGTR